VRKSTGSPAEDKLSQLIEGSALVLSVMAVAPPASLAFAAGR
jgi:hypothetical protein